MRIQYRILWIEDTESSIEPKVEDIKEYLDERGFDPICDVIPKYEDRDFSQYDIIVVDYNLENEEKGSDAIKLIRHEKGIYTEILFYSNSPERTLRKEIAEGSIDGVYCASRETCVERLQHLIDTTIRKTQEINNLRGLVMAETSQLDNLVRDILLKMEWTDEVIADRHTALHKRCDEQKTALKEKPPSLEKVVPFVYEHFHSSFCFESLKGFIAKEIWDDIKTYTEEVVKKRNFLAHGTELPSSATGPATEITIVKTKPDGSTEPLTFTPDDFIELRKKIRDFRGKFEKIIESK